MSFLYLLARLAYKPVPIICFIIEKMKVYSVLTALGFMCLVTSCKKDRYETNKPTSSGPERNVRYELYTDQNFAGDKKNIQFRLLMRTDRKDILDSPLATMKIEEIPDFNHRIIIEKAVPGNDTSTLVVGFTYYIENVGYSWYLEEFPSVDSFKVINRPFR